MRYAACNIAPSCHSLGRYKVRHIIKGYDIALKLAGTGLAHGHPHKKVLDPPVAHQAQLFLYGVIILALPFKKR